MRSQLENGDVIVLHDEIGPRPRQVMQDLRDAGHNACGSIPHAIYRPRL